MVYKLQKLLFLVFLSLLPLSVTGEPSLRMRTVQLQLEETVQETAVSEDSDEAYERLAVRSSEKTPRVSKIQFQLPPGVRSTPPPWLLDDSMKGAQTGGILLPDHLKGEKDKQDKEKKKDDKDIPPDQDKLKPVDAQEAFRRRLAETAEGFLANKVTSVNINGKSHRIDLDCAHFVRAVYWYASGEKTDLFYEAIATGAVEPNIRSGVRLIDTYLRSQLKYSERKPRLGDIVVFDNTWDKNNNQRRDDDLTHLGLVTGFTEDGTIIFIHGNASKTIKKGYINFKHPDWTVKNSRHYNSYGRVKYNWDMDVAGRLNAALVRGFGGF